MNFVQDLFEPALGELLAIDVIGVNDAGQLFAAAAIGKNGAAFEWF
jgi:hypothetical protein